MKLKIWCGDVDGLGPLFCASRKAPAAKISLRRESPLFSLRLLWCAVPNVFSSSEELFVPGSKDAHRLRELDIRDVMAPDSILIFTFVRPFYFSSLLRLGS